MTETVLLEKDANALVEDVHVPPGLTRVITTFGAPDFVAPTLDAWRATYGGLWVGGTVTLTTERVRFAPNGMNRHAQTGDLRYEVLLRELVDVQVTPAALTNIVSLSTETVVCQVRCFGAREFAEAVLEAQRAR